VSSSLAEAARHRSVVIQRVEGERGFRRRLMELGLVPGAHVKVTNVAPLGDPIEIEVRRGRLSIRRVEAASILVER
jgi:Fe2+ transport system protein FeoA